MAAIDLDARAALESTQERLRDGFGEFSERAEDARELVVKRYHDLENDLPDVERTVRRAKIGAWSTFRAVLSALLILPRLIVQLLAALSRLADRAVEVGGEVAERGLDASERGRQLVESLPPSARTRRRSRLRNAAWAGAGFGIGLGTGWALARRQATVVTYDAPYAVDGAPWNAVDAEDGIDGDDTGPNAAQPTPADPGATT